MYLYKKLFPLLIFFALYLLFFGKILFNEKIIYGGNISYQYHTIINDFALNIENSIYPFFSFDYPGSIDYLGESQQSLLNPIKLILIKILTNYNFVDTYFILLSLFIYFFSTTKFIKFIYGKKNINIYGLTFSSLSMVFSLPIFTNFSHPVFIGVLSIFPLFLYYSLRLVENNKSKYLIKFFLINIFFISYGNYALQWLIYLYNFFIILILLYRNSIDLRGVIKIGIIIVISFLFMSPQLFSTFEMMINSSRALPGGFDKFIQSVNPLTILSYLNPYIGSLLYKYSNSDFSTWTYHNLVEGVHFVGITPLICFIYYIKNLNSFKNNKFTESFYLSIFFILLRSFGIFFIFNILLNFLPLFGQFRIPVRSLFLLDFLICISSYVFFRDTIKYNEIIKITNLLIFSILIYLIYFFIIIVLKFDIIEFYNLTTIYEKFSIIQNLILIFIIKLLFKYQLKFKYIKSLFLLILITEIITSKIFFPFNWYTLDHNKLLKTQNEIDYMCSDKGIDRAWQKEISVEYDLPISKISKFSNNRTLSSIDKKEFEASGYNCLLANSVDSSTLSSVNITKIFNTYVNEKPHNSFIFGFDYYLYGASLENLRLNKIEKKLLKSDFILKNYDILFKKHDNSFRKISLQKIYNIFEKNNLKLPTKNINMFSIEDINGSFVFLNRPYNFIFLKNDKILEPMFSEYFIHFPNDAKLDEIKAVYVPYMQIIGLVFTLSSIILIILLFYLSKKISFDKLNINLNFVRFRYHKFYVKFSNKINKYIYLAVNNSKNIISLFYLSGLTICLFLEAGFIYFNKNELSLFSLPLIILYLIYKKSNQEFNFKSLKVDYTISFLFLNFAIGYMIFSIIKYFDKNYFWKFLVL